MAKIASIGPALTVDEVEIYPVKPRGGLVAFASCVVNGQLFLGNIGVHTLLSGEGYRLVFPVKVLPNGKELQCVHPITREAGDLILQAIIRKFEALAANAQRDEDVASTARQPGGDNGDGARVPWGNLSPA